MEPVAQTSNAELVDGREELGRVGDDLDGNCVHCCGQVTLMNKCHLYCRRGISFFRYNYVVIFFVSWFYTSTVMLDKYTSSHVASS